MSALAEIVGFWWWTLRHLPTPTIAVIAGLALVVAVMVVDRWRGYPCLDWIAERMDLADDRD